MRGRKEGETASRPTASRNRNLASNFHSFPIRNNGTHNCRALERTRAPTDETGHRPTRALSFSLSLSFFLSPFFFLSSFFIFCFHRDS